MSRHDEDKDAGSGSDDRDARPNPRRKTRISRYQKSQERRARQRRGDSRFYNVIFTIIGLTTLIALFVAASALRNSGIDVGFLSNLTAPWLGRFSKLEVIGIGIIALIALISYVRMRRAK